MSISVRFGNVGKRTNSTYQATDADLPKVYDCVLKDGCSIDNPIFLINDTSFNYSYAKWDNRYYFITDVTITRNNLYSVSCKQDTLATYKDAILNTVAFVSYADSSTETWVVDTRIPIKKSTTVNHVDVSAPFLAVTGGLYTLSVVGDEGSSLFAVGAGDIRRLIDGIDSWMDDVYELSRTIDSTNALVELAKSLRTSGAVGNAYGNAPQCIRSCIWTPFVVPGATPTEIKLGSYPTGVTGIPISSEPITGSVEVSIPWGGVTGWRRTTPYTQIFLYLPFVGNVEIVSDNVSHASAITVDYSYTLTDGNISYLIRTGGEILGTYGGSCASNYPIGINQQSSLGDVASAVFGGAEKVLSGGIVGTINNLGGKAIDVASAAYNITNVALTTNISCIGGIGGGAGSGLSSFITCYTIKHPTTENDLEGVLGKPMMTKRQLRGLEGFVQCAGATCSVQANLNELNEINTFLNGGFFIE